MSTRNLKSKSSLKISGGDKKDSNPFAEFVLGLIMICFALPAVWMNERK